MLGHLTGGLILSNVYLIVFQMYMYVLVPFYTSNSIPSGVARFVWRQGQVIKMTAPNRNYDKSQLCFYLAQGPMFSLKIFILPPLGLPFAPCLSYMPKYTPIQIYLLYGLTLISIYYRNVCCGRYIVSALV